LLNLLFAQTGDAAANSDLAERCSASRSIKCKQNSKYSAFPPETNGHQASRSVSMNTSRVAKQPPQRKQKKKVRLLWEERSVVEKVKSCLLLDR